MSPLLRISDLRVEGWHPGAGWMPVVKGVSLELQRGEVVGLIGESGAGKSTIGLAAMGYARPGCRIVSGQVLIESNDLLSMDAEERRRCRARRIAYIAQSAAASFNASLKLGLQLTEAPVHHLHMPVGEARTRAESLCRELDLPYPEILLDKYPHQVSGGQLQRLMAAMAMGCGPELLMLDEPTTAIDVTTQVEVLRAFKRLIREHHTSAVYVTHDLAVVSQLADRIIVLRGGEVVEEGPADAIIFRPQAAYTRQLMAAAARAPADAVRSRGTAKPAPRPATQLELIDVHAAYGRASRRSPINPVLRGVDLRIGRGQVVGIVGESGCGKSTLARTICGLLRPYQGELRLAGAPLAPHVADRRRDTQRRIQLVTQMPDVAFNPKSHVGEILGRPLQFYFDLTAKQRRERVRELLAMVKLPADYVDRLPRQLSGGEKQRVNLARALAASPDVLLCDEVTSALDTIVTAAVLDLLRELQSRLAISLVFISHDISTVASFADRIAVMYAGRVVEEGETEAVMGAPVHPYTELLLKSVPRVKPGWLDGLAQLDRSTQGQAMVSAGLDGCAFTPRCRLAIAGVCERDAPPSRSPTEDRRVECHHQSAVGASR